MGARGDEQGRGPGPAQPGGSESPDPTDSPERLSQLVLARHGQTDHNRERRMQGQIDIPLNEVGREQAASLARALTADPPDVIVSSPLSRALDTARAVGEALDLPVRTDQALIERGFGRWEGLTHEEIRERWPRELEAWKERRSLTGVGGESRAEVAERVGECCRALVAEHPGATVLVVAHGAAITAGISDLLGLDAETFRGISGLENCHRSVLEPLRSDPDGRLMRLLSHNLNPDFT